MAWNENLSDLMDLKKRSGHCDVTQKYAKNPNIGQWVNHEIVLYRLLKSGNNSLSSDARIAHLEKNGFQWNPESQLTLTMDWNEGIPELIEFKQWSGQYDVTQNYTENPSLGCWVINQRRKYKLPNSRKMSLISDERTVQLEKLGFQWETKDPVQEKTLKEISLISRRSINNVNIIKDLRNIPKGRS